MGVLSFSRSNSINVLDLFLSSELFLSFTIVYFSDFLFDFSSCPVYFSRNTTELLSKPTAWTARVCGEGWGGPGGVGWEKATNPVPSMTFQPQG